MLQNVSQLSQGPKVFPPKGLGRQTEVLEDDEQSAEWTSHL